MKAPRKPSKRSRAKSPFIVIGAVIGTIPAVHAAEHRHAALPVERRITLEPERIARALGNGADGYLAKSLSADQIVCALERVHAGETVVPNGAISHSVSRTRR